ncbi:MAG: hypothetical protein ABI646_08520 [Acidobacteriota bacterium]
MRKEMSYRILLTVTILACISAPALAQGKRHDPNDVALELVGQVTNPSPASSFQVGYLSSINGIDSPIFSAIPQNEATALFTFYSDTVTLRVINNGPIRIINREGTISLYYDDTPDGNFSSPDTFRDGQEVMRAGLRHQVILDTISGTFTTTFVLTIDSNDPFVFDGRLIRMGKVGDVLRMYVEGHLNSTAPPAGHFAGNILGDPLIK